LPVTLSFDDQSKLGRGALFFNGIGSKRRQKTFCLARKNPGFPLEAFFSKFDVPLVSETGITVFGGAADAASFV
jgi:hypothetical protein